MHPQDTKPYGKSPVAMVELPRLKRRRTRQQSLMQRQRRQILASSTLLGRPLNRHPAWDLEDWDLES